MNPELKKFFEKLTGDTQLQEKMAQCKSAAEAYQLAVGTGDGFTMEEFQKAMSEVQKASSKDELTAEDLESVAGGIDTAILIADGISIGARCAAAAM